MLDAENGSAFNANLMRRLVNKAAPPRWRPYSYGHRILAEQEFLMIQRETAEPVVRYLRTLTYNGELSTDEVWQLAEWLNQQPDKIVESWPAKSLVGALQTAFADKKLTEAELEELANTIVAIEELWMEAFPESADREAEELLTSAAIVEESKPEAPSIPIAAEMPDESRADTFTVDLQHHTCTCPDWVENRAAFPEGDYRRCCVHLLRAFQNLAQEHESVRRDPLFTSFIEEQNRRNQGAEVDSVWRVVVVNGTRVLYGAAPTSEWVNVFAPGDDGAYRRFGYNRRKRRWTYGDRPPDVAWHMESIFSQSQPQVLSPRASTIA
jgi:hypothetical protein